MPAKSKSPEEAQKRLWTQEIKTLEGNRRKVNRDFDREARKHSKTVDAAKKTLKKAEDAAGRFNVRALKIKTSSLADIDTRISILRGRIEA